MRRLKWAVLGAVVGYVYGRVSMLWFDIDEYHAVRMDFWQHWAELKELLAEGNDA